MDWRGLAGDLGIIAGALASIGVLLWAIGKAWKFFRRVGEVLDLLLGDPFARPPKLSIEELYLKLHEEQLADRAEFREHLVELHRLAGENVRQMRRGSGPKREAEHG